MRMWYRYLAASLLSLVALTLFVVGFIAYWAGLIMWGGYHRYPVSGHPKVIMVSAENDHAVVLYVSHSAKHALQTLINSPLPPKSSVPVGYGVDSRFPTAQIILSFTYPFSVREAHAWIYELPCGVLVDLYQHADCPGKALFIGGKSAILYRRLFHPLFSNGVTAATRRQHVVF